MIARWCFVIGVVVLLSTMLPSAAGAQAETGGISGRVVDKDQAPFPGVTITVKSREQQHRLISEGNGTFALTNLVPGTYDVAAALAGFVTERRRIEVKANETTVVDFTLRVGGCTKTITISDHQPLVDPRIPPRSDLFAHLRIEQRIDDDSRTDPGCRIRFRATLVSAVARSSYHGPFSGTIDVLMDAYPDFEAGKEYVVWLAWRPDTNVFDGGSDIETLVRPVENGRVNPHRGPCLAVQNPPPNYCPQTYSVGELFAIFERMFDR